MPSDKYISPPDLHRDWWRKTLSMGSWTYLWCGQCSRGRPFSTYSDFPAFGPLPFVSFLARSIVLNPRNLPYYVRVWAFPHPPGVLAWWKPPPRSPINYPEYFSFLETSVASSPAQLALPLSFPPQRLCYVHMKPLFFWGFVRHPSLNVYCYWRNPSP